MVSRNLIVKYRRSGLGLLWTLLAPLGTCLVFYIVFKQVINIKVPFYLTFVLSGLLPWSFFLQTVIEGTESIYGNMGLITKIPMPIQVFPLVGVVTNFFTLCMGMPIVFGAAFLTGVPFTSTWLMVPLYLFILGLTTYAISWILSIAYIYLRDLKHAVTLIFQMLFYTTPIVYSDSMIPQNLKVFLYLNPVSFIFIGIRKALLDDALLPVDQVVCMLVWCSVLLGIAVAVHRRWSSSVVEML